MSLFNRFPEVLPSWAEILVFDEGNTTYTANTFNYYLYVNTNGQDVTITLPSDAEASRAFNVRKINDSADILTIITDNVECSINGNTELSTNSILASLSVIMGLDGNYWSSGGSGSGGSDGSGGGNVSFVDIVCTPQANGYYINFINFNYIPIMSQNSSSIIIEFS